MVTVECREAARRQPLLESLRRVARECRRVALLRERESRRGGVRAVAHQLEREPLDVGLRLCLRRHPVACTAANLKTVGSAARANRSRLCGRGRYGCGRRCSLTLNYGVV